MSGEELKSFLIKSGPAPDAPGFVGDADSSYFEVHDCSVLSEEDRSKWLYVSNENDFFFIVKTSLDETKLTSLGCVIHSSLIEMYTYISGKHNMRIVEIEGTELTIAQNDEGVVGWHDMRGCFSPFDYDCGSPEVFLAKFTI